MYGIYIHFPFCLSKCPYCDFYSVKFSDYLKRDYIEALKNQIRSFPPVDADTVYFGGGTPSLMTSDDIGELLDTIHSSHHLSQNSEISMECNPATADINLLKDFRLAGVNRLSIGCQSFDGNILQKLGRIHSSQQAKQTVADAFSAGFDNVSVDLMLGTPYQTPLTAAHDALTAAELGVTHVSAYLLKICEGTPFSKGIDGIPGDETAAECYEILSDTLAQKGYGKYEISNFSLPGRESIHNLKYWQCGSWLGLGPAAHMSDGIRRFSTPSDLCSFIKLYSDGPISDPIDHMNFEGSVDGEEYIITSLRTSTGLDYGILNHRFDVFFSSSQLSFIDKLVNEGLASWDGLHLALTDRGMLVSNSIISELI